MNFFFCIYHGSFCLVDNMSYLNDMLLMKRGINITHSLFVVPLVYPVEVVGENERVASVREDSHI